MAAAPLRSLLHAVLSLPCLLFVSIATSPAQVPDSVRVDTTLSVLVPVDSVAQDSVVVSAGDSPSGRDDAIIYTADDILRDFRDPKKVILIGNADVTVGEDRLRAAYIEINFETSELFARSRLDSATGDQIGVPTLDYAGEQLSALTLRYNFKTGQGVSTAAEFAIEEGLVKVDRFKRVSPEVVFAENGHFTTCDLPHPHFYFKAEKMKLQSDDLIFADQLHLYIEDVPVLALPVGFFFALGGGRHSGLILPSFRQSTQRGVELTGLGYFLIVNDYLDTKLTTDLSSQGGYNFDSFTRFRLRDHVERADLRVEYSLTRTNVEDPFERILELDYDHSQKFGPDTRLTADLYFTNATDPIRRTTTDLNNQNVQNFDNLDEFEDITRQRITSSAGFSSIVSPLGIDLPYTLGYRNDRNIVTDEISAESYSASINPRRWTPFAGDDIPLLQSLSLGLSPRFSRIFSRTDTLAGGGFANVQTSQGISLSPTISLSPKLGYFTIAPTATLNSSIFFRRLDRTQSPGGEIQDAFVDGIEVPFWYSVGANASTTLYGIVQPGIFGIEAIRHRISPSIGITIAPDFSDPSFGFYDRYTDTAGNEILFSVFDADRRSASVPGAGEQRTLRFGLVNSFEAKINRGDTLDAAKITILDLNANGGYNLADSLRPIQPITVSASTSLAQVGWFSANTILDPYERDTLNTFSNRTPGVTLPFPWVRFQRTSFSFGTTLSNEGFISDPFLTERPDSVGYRPYRDPTARRGFNREQFFGERVRGDNSFRVPWSIGLSGSYVLNPTDTGFASTFSVTTDLTFSITPTTEVRASGSYDLDAGRFNIPEIRLNKDLHDWILSVRYNPTGFAEQFTVSIGFKPSLLRDLEQDFRF